MERTVAYRCYSPARLAAAVVLALGCVALAVWMATWSWWLLPLVVLFPLIGVSVVLQVLYSSASVGDGLITARLHLFGRRRTLVVDEMASATTCVRATEDYGPVTYLVLADRTGTKLEVEVDWRGRHGSALPWRAAVARAVLAGPAEISDDARRALRLWCDGSTRPAAR